MILILIESTDALTVYYEGFEGWLSSSVVNLYWLVPDPETLHYENEI